MTKPGTQCDALVHCWHVTSSTTNGLAVTGYDREVCCWCGKRRKNHWRIVKDPAHGPHVEDSKIMSGVKYDYEPRGA